MKGGKSEYIIGRMAWKEMMVSSMLHLFFLLLLFGWCGGGLSRERTLQFAVQAYMAGPQNVNLQETGPVWLKFEEALSHYEDAKK